MASRLMPRLKRGDEGVAEHVRVDLCPQAGGLGQVPQAAGRRKAVHPGAAAVEQDRAVVPAARCPVDGPADRWRQRDMDHFAALAAHAQHPVVVLLAEVGDIGTGGFEDPQAQRAEHGHQGEVAWVR